MEEVKINQITPISFTYKSPLKTEWLKGNMPSVTHGIYGGILTKDNITLEHIKPHSKGGKTSLKNLALAVDENNFKRGSKPIWQFLTKEMFEQYIEQFKNIFLPDFNGKEYAENLTKTVERLIK